MNTQRILRIEDDGWCSIWIAEYVGDSGTRQLERFSGHGSFEANMAAARKRLKELEENE